MSIPELVVPLTIKICDKIPVTEDILFDVKSRKRKHYTDLHILDGPSKSAS